MRSVAQTLLDLTAMFYELLELFVQQPVPLPAVSLFAAAVCLSVSSHRLSVSGSGLSPPMPGVMAAHAAHGAHSGSAGYTPHGGAAAAGGAGPLPQLQLSSSYGAVSAASPFGGPAALSPAALDSAAAQLSATHLIDTAGTLQHQPVLQLDTAAALQQASASGESETTAQPESSAQFVS